MLQVDDGSDHDGGDDDIAQNKKIKSIQNLVSKILKFLVCEEPFIFYFVMDTVICL